MKWERLAEIRRILKRGNSRNGDTGRGGKIAYTYGHTKGEIVLIAVELLEEVDRLIEELEYQKYKTESAQKEADDLYYEKLSK